MPTTVNGIGTHYYGRRNEERRQGACRHCGASVELISYDTRLWFVFVFIPVIPLGRKRIVDQCSSCRRHYALELRQWESAKQSEITAALEKFRGSGTPESAIEAHQTLINFHQSAQAAEFRQLLRTKFANDAKVQAYLGAVCEHLGQLDEAGPYYARALELNPQLPDARVGVAEDYVRQNRLDEARPLLDFLEKPGASAHHSLAPLETLALGFQTAGRHTEAMELFNKLLTELPQLANHTGFRKMVERSEKALGRPGTVLPARKFSWSRWFGSDPTAPRTQAAWRVAVLVGVVLVLTIIGFVAYNEYVRRHRTIHIINALEQPAEVEVRGIGRIRATTGISRMTVAEGRHHLIVRGLVTEEYDLEVKSGYSDRWMNNPAWVVNVGREAVLVLTTAHYSKDPQPSQFDLVYGQSYYHFPNIDRVFEPLPETMKMEAHEQRTLTQLDVYSDPPAAMFQYLQQAGRLGDAWRLAEWYLPRHRDDENMLHLFANAAGPLRKTDTAEKLLRAGLTNRPVEIEWHRSYQSIQRDRKRNTRLAGEYDAMLQAEPGDSALLYLRGRVAPDSQEARRYYDRAIAADGSNAFPHFAIAYERIAAGDWEGARPSAERAATLRPKDGGFVGYFGLVRLALREFDSLEEEYRARLKQNPGELQSVVRLCDVLMAAGKTNDVREVVAGFERSRAGQGEGGYEITSYLRRHVFYIKGDFGALEKFAVADRSPVAKLILFQALLEQGKVKEALNVRPAEVATQEDPFGSLTISLAWAVSGKPEEARDWRERAARGLENGDEDYLRAAALLRGSTGPTRQQLDLVVLPANAKAIWLAVLAHQFPDQRNELLAASRRLNVERNFPFQLVQRATEAKGQ